MDAASASRPDWFRIGSADLVFLILALIIVQAGRQNMLDDPGLGWHLRDIDAMRQQGGWLTQDPFSGPRGGAAYLTNQWLGELPLYLGWRWAGLEGIAAVTAVVLALTLACLFRMLLRDGLPWPVAGLWTALAALGTSCSWVARPNVFTLLFVLLTARVCEQFHQGRVSRWQTLWLWPLFAVWANVHGGFVAGFGLLGLTFLVEVGVSLFGSDLAERQRARDRAGHVLLLFGGALLATLVNPYGIGLYPWIFSLLGDPYFMKLHMEWLPPDFAGVGAWRFEVVILLLPLLLGVTRRRPNLVELAFVVAGLHAALTGFRYVPLWVLLAIPLLARSSVEVPLLQDLARRLGLTAAQAPLFAPTPGRAPWTWTVLIAAVLLAGVRLGEGRFAGHNPKYIPAADLDHLLEITQEKGDPVVLHDYNWGGYLTWEGWPTFRNWIDDRNEVQGQDHVKEHFDIVAAGPKWERKLDRNRVGLIALPGDTSLIRRLEEQEMQARQDLSDPTWIRIFPSRRDRPDLRTGPAVPVVVFERVRARQRDNPEPVLPKHAACDAPGRSEEPGALDVVVSLSFLQRE